MPTLGLAVIVRDEEHSLPTLLQSITGAFDHVALVDTGSTDQTVSVFTDWAQRTGQPHTLDTFQWIDDFSAARNHAHSLLKTDWNVWADADDEIIGARNLREALTSVPDDVAGISATYDYDDHNIVMRRERLVRQGRGRWTGRVHEQQQITGAIRVLPADIAYWRHTRNWTRHVERNEKIAERWKAEDPFDYQRWRTERDLYLHASELQGRCRALEEMLQAAADRLTELTAA